MKWFKAWLYPEVDDDADELLAKPGELKLAESSDVVVSGLSSSNPSFRKFCLVQFHSSAFNLFLINSSFSVVFFKLVSKKL